MVVEWIVYVISCGVGYGYVGFWYDDVFWYGFECGCVFYGF